MNAHPNESGARNDRDALLSMRDAARPVSKGRAAREFASRIGWNTSRPPTSHSRGAILFESILTCTTRYRCRRPTWVERALEHATQESPVSVVRCSNVQGCFRTHQFAQDSIFGWLSVPGDGTQVKDFIHIMDVIEIIMHVLQNPPLTRETPCIGSDRP